MTARKLKMVTVLPWFAICFVIVWLDHAIRAIPEAWDQAYRMILK